MFRKARSKIAFLFLAAMSMVFSACSFVQVKAEELVDSSRADPSPVSPLGIQVLERANEGLTLDLEEFQIAFPGNIEDAENRIDLSGAVASLQLKEPSLHGLNVRLDAPLDYNGLQREINVTLFNEELYFSVGADRDEGASYDIRYKTTLNAYDIGAVDETTHGITYYEYGQLDFVLSEILTALEITQIDISSDSFGSKFIFDYDAILDSLSVIQEYDASRYLWELPLGENIYRVGLVHDDQNVLSGFEFPVAGDEEVVFSGGASVKIKANILSDQSVDWSLPFDKESYTPLEDSLALFRRIASFAKRKSLQIGASFELYHKEDEIAGDDTHFATPGVEEECSLELEANCDFQNETFGETHVEATLAKQGGGEQSLLLHTQPSSSEEGTDFFLNLANVMKVRTNSLILNALFSAGKDAFTDESIQNEDILKMIASILNAIEAIQKTVEAFQETALYDDINRGEYHHILATIIDIAISANHMELTIDLTPASLEGTARVVLNGTTPDSPLGYVEFNHAGIHSSNDSHTMFLLDGRIFVGDYQKKEIDFEEYEPLSHIPHWTEEIKAISAYDQLQVQLDGYALKKGTTSAIATETADQYVFDPVLGRGRKEQGFAFHGSLAFDLKNRIGTGTMDFLDAKENYVNDHKLSIDFTGEPLDSDTDENDMRGSGNQNAMFFEYSSRNFTASSEDGVYESENRSEPKNGSLKGRFSVHSISGILEVVRTLTDSNDPRFKRLTSLLGSMSANTLLKKALSGQYFDLLTSNILSSFQTQEDSTTLEIAPGVLDLTNGLTLKLGYAPDGAPKSIEVWMTLGDESATEIYAKITLGETHFDSFPYQFADHTPSNYTDYSSLKTLLSFALDTITLGNTDERAKTAYHIAGSVGLKLEALSFTVKDVQVSFDLYIVMEGTNLKIIGRVFSPKTNADLLGLVKIINKDTYTNIFYETDGQDTSGTLFLTRLTDIKNYTNRDTSVPTIEPRKVHGNDFMTNIIDWLAKYVLNMSSTVTDLMSRIDSESTKAFHGEDIVESIAVSNASLSSPSWDVSIGLGALAHTDILGSLNATISGKNVTYGSEASPYHKNTLYSLNGQTLIDFTVLKISAAINLTMENVSSGRYVDIWETDNAVSVYQQESVVDKDWLGRSKTKYYYSMLQGSGSSIWNGPWGKTNANTRYAGAQFYSDPDTVVS